MNYEPRASYKFRRIKELIRAKEIGTTVKSTTNSRKTNYTTEYEAERDIEEKSVIDEINRLNMTSDYGV